MEAGWSADIARESYGKCGSFLVGQQKVPLFAGNTPVKRMLRFPDFVVAGGGRDPL
jgi:hypothetical protein